MMKVLCPKWAKGEIIKNALIFFMGFSFTFRFFIEYFLKILLTLLLELSAMIKD